jgi:ATP-dependent RNA helicase SUPV3L1/SUV3
MRAEQAARGRVLAVLGPTNTGKTHFAVERMLGHSTGMMGFPLRLLAREIYDRVVALKGADAVALRTGEEKLGRDDARYQIATVEAMPLDRPVGFLAVDEIQLCADPERGHVFTDRLLHARGLDETIFLGSDTIRPVLKQLVPEAELITRPRFSTLAHAGHHKLARLPRRSAVVAFTTADVYTLAEVIRRHRGGAAVVLGALSPRTRNAQVALYQSGEVDHLVATDAIGMGLNMDLAHVAFASVHKFDGRTPRRLHASEVGQIAGRAGRHMADGTFGTTNGCPEMDQRVVEAVEGHAFAPLKALRWRNTDLDFGSVPRLQASLDAAPPARVLVKMRDALDDRSLALLATRDDVRARADSPERVRLLWQVCQIPDFRKTLTEAHLQILGTVFGHVTHGRGTLPDEWVGRMVSRLDRVDGDIDALVARLAHIRTWTYLAHRADWLDDAAHWQGLTREVEDRLSDALHERLTQRFVDRRTAALMRSLRERGDMPAVVEAGELVVDGHALGRLDGLSFTPAASDAETGRGQDLAAARKALAPELMRRAKALVAAPDLALELTPDDTLRWEGAVVARLTRSADPLRPRLRLAAAEALEPAAAVRVEERLAAWLDRWLERRLASLLALDAAARGDTFKGPARAVAFSLVEGLGSAERAPLDGLVERLDAADRQALTRQGVRFGRLVLYVADLLRPAAIEARLRLLRVAGAAGPAMAAPEPGRTVVRDPALALDPALARRLGFLAFGDMALRQDVAERLAAGLRARAHQGAPFALPVELAAEAGLTRGELEVVLQTLGYRGRAVEDAMVWSFDQRRRRRQDAPRPPAPAGSPFAALAALKVAS